ncbi:MAG: ankyrin repeat domain-containing protein, partial [Allosphingosinicella sp.]
MFNKFGRALAAATVLMLAVPASGQQNFSDSYNFLKAVRERDGAKVSDLVAEPGSVVINTRDRGSGEGALHIVIRGRDLNWLAFLLGKGARPDIQSGRGETPLTLAA